MDEETTKLAADYFAQVERLNPQRITVQAGWYDQDHYIVRIRFKDLVIPAATGGMRLQYTCEHLLDIPTTNLKLRKAIGRPMQRGDLALWLLGDRIRVSNGVFEPQGVLADTLEMAWNEYVLNRKRRWPEGYPKPRSQKPRSTSH
jgi:hypothetical protein